MKSFAIVVLAVMFGSSAWATTQTVTLSVSGMTCAACPITVKMAISKVAGVERTEVSFEKREAVVSFDDARTDVDALIKATGNAGFPSTLKR